MKTIKRERQVRLDELLKYVWDKGITDEIFFTTGRSIRVNDFGCFTGLAQITKSDLFTITEEVEIDEDTKLDLVEIYEISFGSTDVAIISKSSINEILKNDQDGSMKTKFIYLQNNDGSIGELIWSKERGLVD